MNRLPTSNLARTEWEHSLPIVESLHYSVTIRSGSLNQPGRSAENFRTPKPLYGCDPAGENRSSFSAPNPEQADDSGSANNEPLNLMSTKALVLFTAVWLPLTALAVDPPEPPAKASDPAGRIKELETRVDQLQRELQALQLDRLNGRWRLVATQNETRKVRFRVGSVLDVQLSKLSLDRVPGTLEFLPDGSLKLVIDQDEVVCKPAMMGDYLKLELQEGIRYFFKRIPPTSTPQSS